MNTIDEVAEEYSKKHKNYDYTNEGKFYYGFKAGVEFAQKWISVKEELPEINIPVLIKTSTGKIVVAWLYDDEGYRCWNTSKSDTMFFKYVTHWRPIEYK